MRIIDTHLRPSAKGFAVTQIHPSAIVHPSAEIGENVTIGPFCVVEENTKVGDGCQLNSFVSIKQGTRLGANNKVHEHAVIGGPPQHLRAGSDLGDVIIGTGNVIREFTTIHRGLAPGKDTVIGDNNLLMVQAHVGHDTIIGNNTIITNNVMLGGHVVIEDRAYVSGAVAVHQFCRIGRNAMVGGQAHVVQDVAPYVTVDGCSSLVVGLNIIGLKRSGFSPEQLSELKRAYRIIFRSNLTNREALERVRREFPMSPAVHFADFLAESERGFIQARSRGRGVDVSRPQLRVLSNGEDNTSDASRRAG
ncbi:acyl-[acyl-carrier-protein]--UDP-N-acetylglucosamine O-acyltransferase [Blastopirellula marina]|uniref:Acyl-[acyl-carrier-protein]--UDP-N-acetylglucosamine O-acyltransferase n=1 Tax=Blastopirellula marina TaxID=124 RepID=A0A2S8GBH2_9BACT|nr:acyl-[acyl-carrier-protein]--UDP-N-acetylglucosamine O-acyltransferase [Blastopirellula marina]RCS56358.1 acyl-ACP--UDP-N-acetylglucosamine O-acyltransferase [Bremerella cremea]